MKPEPRLITLRRLGAACAWSAAGLAVFALGTWALGRWRWGTFGEGRIPMAPATAVLMALAGLAGWLQGRDRNGAVGRACIRVAALVILLVSAGLGLDSLFGWTLPLEGWLSRSTETVGDIPVGRMSSFAAGAFVGVAGVLLLRSLSPARRGRWHAVAGGLALAVWLFSLTMLLSYALEVSFLYGSTTIPMALLTSVAFLLLSLALLLGGHREAWPARLFLAATDPPGAAALRRGERSLVLLFLLLAGGILVGGLFTLRQLQASARATALRELEAIAELKAGQIADWMNERRADAEMARDDYQARLFLAEPANAALGEQLRQWMETFRRSFGYAALALFDGRGSLLLAEPAAAPVGDAHCVARIQAALSAAGIVVEDLHVARPDGPIHLTLISPIRLQARPDQPADGVLVLMIDPNQFLYPLVQRWPVPSETAETLLVRREGQDALFLNELRHLKGTALKLRRPLNEPRLPAAMAARGQFGTVEGVDYRGVPVVSVVRAIPQSPWAMVAKVDKAEVYTPLRRDMLLVVGVMGGLLLAATLGVGWRWRQQAQAVLQRANDELEQRIQERTADLRQSNRALRMLSDCNQALVHATGEQQLLDELCRLIVEQGGYRLCWVGYAEQDETMSVRPMAQAGFEEGYLQQLDLTWADTERGRGPTGTAIRTGQPCAARNLQTDPSFAPWRAEALQRGYASSLCLPLRHEGQVLGALNIYSAAPEAFDAAETELLTELAGDLAFGIATLRTRAARQEAVDALRRQQEFTNALLQSAADGVVACDATGALVLFNQIAREWHGLGARALPPEEWARHYDLYEADGQTPLATERIPLVRAFQGENLRDVGMAIVAKGQPPRFVLASGGPFFDGQGRKLGAVVAMRDITERKRAEAAVRASEERLRFALETSHTGAWDLDLVDHTAFRSLEHDRIFGYAELLPQWTYERFLDHVLPEDRARVDDKFRRATEARSDWSFECRIRRVDGQERWIWAAGHHRPDAAGAARRMAGIVQDITERKQAEAEIRQLNASLEQRVRERTAELARANEQLQTEARAREQAAAALRQAHDELEQRVAQRTAELRTSNETLRQEIAARERAQAATVAEARRVQELLAQAEQSRRALLGVVEDQRQAEEEIRRLNADLERRVAERTAQLQEANKELESFSYSVSHDLRAPLRHVQGYAQMLARELEGRLSEKARSHLKTITEASGEMGQLIDDLLAFSRTSRAELKQDTVDLNPIVRETIRRLEMATPGRNIAWKIAPLPLVRGDEGLLKQVLANLVGNAVKYTRPRNPAEIEIGVLEQWSGGVAATAQNAATVSSQSSNPPALQHSLVFFVRDNGVGFDMKYQHKLFGVFQRLHQPEEFEGTGIGLATVRRILGRHGGRVWAEARPEAGATFYFTLARAQKPA